MSTFLKLMKDENGANAIEYGLIAALIAVVIIASLTALGNKESTQYRNISNRLPTGSR